MVRRLLMIAVAVVLSMAVALPASAGATAVEKLTDFYTTALQDDGEFQWVYCSQATRVVKPDGSAVETYKCELTEWIAPPNTPPGMSETDLFGPIVYQDSAMRFTNDTGFFYFSDFLFLECGEIHFATTWREQLTPSGQVQFKADYSDAGSCPPPPP